MEQARQNAVGATVRKLRSAQNLTQELLAAKCGVAGYDIPRGTLAKIEAQIRGVSDLELFVLAKVLRVPIEALYPPGLGTRLKAGEYARPV